VTAILTSLPFAQFHRHPRFYFVYDSVFLLGAAAFVAALSALGYRPAVRQFSWPLLALLPVVTYFMILAHVFIHNASHRNFPRAVNRIVGEVCGVIVVTKFASWEIVHRRHHRHSDDPALDPHPATRDYWAYAMATLVNVEKQLQQQYFEVHGDTPAARTYERWRSRLSFVSGAMLFLAWYALLGAPIFIELFAPAFVFAALFVIFFNWAGHNAHLSEGAIEPTNIDTGIFWILNRMFFGIFYHGNHHKTPSLFNPMNMRTSSR
jgi:stearoyl-CoA desaturase (delta-9 desaturase)